MKLFDIFRIKKKASNIGKIFLDQKFDEENIRQFADIADPRIKYIIAITPRSGSSLLCDVMKNSNALGTPGEILPEEFIPQILGQAPGQNPDEYLLNVLKMLQTGNGVSGLKTSWFQFQTFFEEMQDRTTLQQFKYIYLVRRDIFAQAVSLYKATSTSVFHTNIKHADEALDKLASLEYDFEQIDEWYRHIRAQESGWQDYFDEHRIFPLLITYEDLESDVVAVVKRIGSYLGIPESEISSCVPESIFKKIGDRVNLEWACRFELELDDQTRHGKINYFD